MSKPRVLVQLDADLHASVFDAVVAVDSGVDQLLSYHSVKPSQVRGLVHGAIFTRGPQDLHNTAVFVGGSQVDQGEELLREVVDSFFGPMRVSVMLDANGANTTAAAAVLAAEAHADLAGTEALVLAATGAVGRRIVRLLAREGARVRVASRQIEKAEQVCRNVEEVVPGSSLTPVVTDSAETVAAAMSGARIVISAGAIGVRVIPKEAWKSCEDLRVAIDLNAVPPLGIEGTEAGDQAVERDGILFYGAIGVGGTKMKIHKAAIRRLFETNDLVLDAEEIFAIGRSISAS